MVTEMGCVIGKFSLRQSVRMDDDRIIWKHAGIDHHIDTEDVLEEFDRNFGDSVWMDTVHARMALSECIYNHWCEFSMTDQRPPNKLRIEVAAFVLQAVAQQRGMTYHMTPNQDYVEIYGLPRASAASTDC